MVNHLTKFVMRIARFLAFQSIYRERQIKFFLIKLKSKDIIVKNVQGNGMYLDLKDEGISKDLILDGIREPESTREIAKILKTGNVVVEAGANIGYYALMESRLIGKKGVVYAVEPSPKNFENLNRNIKLNKITNMKTYQLAIGDKTGKAKMNISPYSNLSSLVKQKNRRVTETIEVKVTTLDSFLKGKRHPDFVRMDVEGYEYNILKGMKGILKSKKPIKIFIELHPHIMKKNQTIYVLKILKKHGFETRKVIRSVTVAEMKVMTRKQYDYSYMSINDLLKNEDILSGKKGAFEIFFERK